MSLHQAIHPGFTHRAHIHKTNRYEAVEHVDIMIACACSCDCRAATEEGDHLCYSCADDNDHFPCEVDCFQPPPHYLWCVPCACAHLEDEPSTEDCEFLPKGQM